jgi:2-oxoisovalerate dehydrogenase E1 component
VAAGIALNKKINNKPGIAVSFIGEGTLGEGVIYETLNMNVLYKIPHLIVCENNFYSQSTPQHQAVAGDILDRPRSFGMKVFEANVWDLVGLLKISKEAIAYVRNNSEPAFLLIRTYRLNAHSKGDDNRNSEEINFFKEYDPINQLLEDPKWKNIKTDWDFKISQHIASVNASKLSLKEYEFDELSRVVSARLRKISNKNIRMVHALNLAYGEVLERGAFFIGEDISDPYGGAFKITKGFSTQRPSQVISTPISEAALVGISIGMTLAGAECYAEIMFGDFITHAFDQLINNASKMHHMTAFQISAPVRIRTPMGGKRGYGPTHSQSLEKFLLGIDNVGVISFTSLVDPEAILDGIQSVKSPLVMLENKLDYSNKLWVDNSGFELFQEVKAFGSLILRSSENVPTITIVSYGETARSIADNLQQIFIETDFIPELICLVQLHPLDLGLVRRSLKKTKRLLVVEDGSVSFGLGAEILASLIEAGEELVYAKRIGAAPVPIPSATGLESEILPTVQRIVKMINMGGI